MSDGNMYANARTWSPFKGCEFACTYCGPSFQRQARRQKHRCSLCYRYTPHCHEERLAKIPPAKIVFVCGNGDIAFCPPEFLRRVLAAIRDHLARCRRPKTFYLQSKQPECFAPFLDELPPEVILVTTLETNRDLGYEQVSQAPMPSQRYRQFKALAYPRKVVTVEPLLDFDLEEFAGWIIDLRPEYVWLGYNSRPEQVRLPEPAAEKVQELARRLTAAGIEVRGKTLRGIDLPTGAK